MESPAQPLPSPPLPAATLDAIFSGNRLLATLAPADRALIEPHVSVREFAAGDPILHVGEPATQALFPFDALMVSMMIHLAGERSVEVASVGKEGAIGGIISCGEAPAFTESVVQVPGSAAVVPMEVLEKAKDSSPHIKNLFCRYSDFLLSQVMQSVACNAFHPVEARAARWLLHTHDRVGDRRITLTQGNLADLLGVQRTTVNAVAREFQEQGLISYRRGAIEVADRTGLSRVACECYQSVEDHFTRILGPDGQGGCS